MDYEGLTKGILPGYNVDLGVANRNNTLQWALQRDQWMDLENTGVIGPQSFRQYAENWYFSSYDPNDVKAWGSPTDTKLGVSYATWQPIIKAATSDIQYINAWTAKQPLKYRESVDPPGTLSMTQQLKDFEKTYTEAKTPTAKPAAWTAFWQWVGTYAAGTAGMVPGLNAQVHADKYELSLEYHMRIWEGELDETSSAKPGCPVGWEDRRWHDPFRLRYSHRLRGKCVSGKA